MAPTLHTPRLALRPWRDDDLKPWIAMGADARVMEFFESLSTQEKAEAQAAKMRRRLEEDGFGWWVLDIKDVTPFAGVIALQNVPFAAAFTPAIEVGWRLMPEYWGSGYATEGAQAAIDFAFAQLHAPEVVAITAVTNLRSQRVMQRLGMTYDRRDDFINPMVSASSALAPHVLYRIGEKGTA